MSVKSKWKTCPHCNSSILAGDMQHESECKKEQDRKSGARKQIKEITNSTSKEAFDRAKPW